jgi:hypothetical protein
MKKILIIGAGPRGLSVALQACFLNYDITIIDPTPLSTWSIPNIIDNIYMRSPITFDLTTFNSNLRKFSLSNFLKKDINSFTQQEVEETSLFCSRIEFKSYLDFIVLYLQKQNVKFYKEHVNTIHLNKVVSSSNTELFYDYLIIATGSQTQELKIPCYLNKKNIILPNQIFNNNWKDKEIYVLGSGQQSAEYVYYLKSKKAVPIWIQKHRPIISQYPVPSFKEWGSQSALGNFYSTQIFNKDLYLKQVKEWGPSITPYINNKLKKFNYITIKDPKTTQDLNLDIPFVIATGYTQNIDKLQFNFNLEKDKSNNCLPNITKDFQSTSNSNIYFTGLLASRYDGPRQGSIISASLTSEKILNSINAN